MYEFLVKGWGVDDFVFYDSGLLIAGFYNNREQGFSFSGGEGKATVIFSFNLVDGLIAIIYL